MKGIKFDIYAINKLTPASIFSAENPQHYHHDLLPRVRLWHPEARRAEPLRMTSAEGRAELVGVACTARAFPLLVAGPYNIPYCLDRPGEGHRIVGEVYKIDDEKLQRLDELEAYPEHYNRWEKGAKWCLPGASPRRVPGGAGHPQVRHISSSAPARV